MAQDSLSKASAMSPDGMFEIRRNVALAMLFLVGTINFVDRQLLSVLVETQRASGLSATEITSMVSAYENESIVG